jgi:hypothetical protein
MTTPTWQDDARRQRDETAAALTQLRAEVPVPEGDREHLLTLLERSGAQVVMCGREPTLEDFRSTVHEALILAAYDAQCKASWEVRRSHCACCPPPGNRGPGRHTGGDAHWFHAPQGEWKRLGVLPANARALIETFGADESMQADLALTLAE